MTPMQTRILAAITDAGDWIKADVIAGIVGCSNGKAVQIHVSKMRSDGVVIEGTIKGYRMPVVAVVDRKKFPRDCACGAPVTKASKTGLCRPCCARRLSTDPAFMSARINGMRVKFNTPEARRTRSEGARKRYSDPAARAVTGEAVRKALAKSPEKHREAARRNMQVAIDNNRNTDWSTIHRERAAARKAWCPDDRWAEYEAVRRQIGAPAAKAAMLELFRREEERRIAALSPLERQLEKLRNGGVLVDKFVPRMTDPAFTLGGVSEMAA